MQTFRTASVWPLLAFSFFLAFFSGCKKDLPVLTTEAAKTGEWKVSQETFDRAKSSLKGEAVVNFFDFDFAAKNNPNIAEVVRERDANQDVLNALCVELIEQNQQYNFAPALISQVGYPIWSRAIFLQNEANNNTPVVLLPFARLGADSTDAWLMATPLDSTWFFELNTRQVLNTTLSVQTVGGMNMPFVLLSFFAFDKDLFDVIDEHYLNASLTGVFNAPPVDLSGFPVIAQLAVDYDPLIGIPVVQDRDVIPCLCFPYRGGNNAGPWFSGGSSGGGGGSGIGFTPTIDGASVEWVGLWTDYTNSLDPDYTGDGEWTQSQKSQFAKVKILEDLGLFSLFQLEVAYNNVSLMNALILYLQANPGQPLAQDVAGLLLNVVGQGILNESQAMTLLALQDTLDLSIGQVGWLVLNQSAITQTGNAMTAFPNDPLLVHALQDHIGLLMEDYAYFGLNVGANFPEIGTAAWAETLNLEGGYKATAEEKQLATVFPAGALIIRANAPVAILAAQTNFPNATLALRNGKPDAFRHAFFQAINTRDVGETITDLFANAHESETPAHLVLEKTMDIFNNGVGKSKSSFGILATNADFEIFIMSAVIQGELRYLSPLNFDDPCYNFCTGVPSGTGGIIIGTTQLIPTDQ